MGEELEGIEYSVGSSQGFWLRKPMGLDDISIKGNIHIKGKPGKVK